MFTAFCAAYLTTSVIVTAVVLDYNGAKGKEWTKLVLAPVMLPAIVVVLVSGGFRRPSDPD